MYNYSNKDTTPVANARVRVDQLFVSPLFFWHIITHNWTIQGEKTSGYISQNLEYRTNNVAQRTSFAFYSAIKLNVTFYRFKR